MSDFLLSNIGGNIQMSGDYGASWSTVYSGGNVISYCDMGSGYLAALTSTGHILKSTDGGNNWSDLGQKIAVTLYTGTEQDFCPKSKLIYLGNQGTRATDTLLTFGGGSLVSSNINTIFRSTDGGTTWGSVTVSMGMSPNNIILSVVPGFVAGECFLGATNTLSALLPQGIWNNAYRSTDFGATWAISDGYYNHNAGGYRMKNTGDGYIVTQATTLAFSAQPAIWWMKYTNATASWAAKYQMFGSYGPPVAPTGIGAGNGKAITGKSSHTSGVGSSTAYGVSPYVYHGNFTAYSPPAGTNDFCYLGSYVFYCYTNIIGRSSDTGAPSWTTVSSVSGSVTELLGFQFTSGYSVTYNGNGSSGGSVPVDGTLYSTGNTVTVLGNTGSLVKTGHSFYKWNTSADGSGTFYAGGDAFSMGSSNVTLYATWNSTWYVNSTSSTQDGLTPATGYHTPGDLQNAKGWIGSGDHSMLPGDMIDVVAGIYNITATGPYAGASNFGTDYIVRSYGTDGTDRAVNKPVINLSLTSLGVLCGASQSITNLIFVRDAEGTAINGTFFGNSILDNFILTGCEFSCVNDTGHSFNFATSFNSVVIENCIFSGISNQVLVSTSASNAKLINNSIYGCGNGSSAVINMYASSNCVVENNIVVGIGTGNGIIVNPVPNGGGSGSTENYNDAYNFSTPFNPPWQGANSITVDPLFTNPSSLDFTLQSSSPCIATGVGPSLDANIPTTSFSGVVRSGNFTDMGAYEAVPSVDGSVLGKGRVESSLNFDFTVSGDVSSKARIYSSVNESHVFEGGVDSEGEPESSVSLGRVVSGETFVKGVPTSGVLSDKNVVGSGKSKAVISSTVHVGREFSGDISSKASVSSSIRSNFVVDFIGTPVSGLSPMTVRFSDLSTNSPIHWLWDFGDGNTSEVQNPVHTYRLVGNFTVSLTVWRVDVL